jgi:hypothetical protein
MSLVRVKNSNKKNQMINEFLNSPLKIGEKVSARKYKSKDFESDMQTIIAIDLENKTVKTKSWQKKISEYSFDDIQRCIYDKGVDPFPVKLDGVKNIDYALDSILFETNYNNIKRYEGEYYKENGTDIIPWNWNPFVIINGIKRYYQRDFVWNLEDKQLLIHSIYNGIACGKIVVRNRSFEEIAKLEKMGIKELSFKDCVDGKQRLNAIICFIENEFTDKNGNYFSDLSTKAQHKFVNNKLFSYCELPEDSKDEVVLEQFLKINFSGIPQSKEHIEYVEKLLKGITN